MADTNTLDIPIRGLPSFGINSLLSTNTLDVPYNGIPIEQIHTVVGGGFLVPIIMHNRRQQRLS